MFFFIFFATFWILSWCVLALIYFISGYKITNSLDQLNDVCEPNEIRYNFLVTIFFKQPANINELKPADINELKPAAVIVGIFDSSNRILAKFVVSLQNKDGIFRTQLNRALSMEYLVDGKVKFGLVTEKSNQQDKPFDKSKEVTIYAIEIQDMHFDRFYLARVNSSIGPINPQDPPETQIYIIKDNGTGVEPKDVRPSTKLSPINWLMLSFLIGNVMMYGWFLMTLGYEVGFDYQLYRIAIGSTLAVVVSLVVVLYVRLFVRYDAIAGSVGFFNFYLVTFVIIIYLSSMICGCVGALFGQEQLDQFPEKIWSYSLGTFSYLFIIFMFFVIGITTNLFTEQNLGIHLHDVKRMASYRLKKRFSVEV